MARWKNTGKRSLGGINYHEIRTFRSSPGRKIFSFVNAKQPYKIQENCVRNVRSPLDGLQKHPHTFFLQKWIAPPVFLRSHMFGRPLLFRTIEIQRRSQHLGILERSPVFT